MKKRYDQSTALLQRKSPDQPGADYHSRALAVRLNSDHKPASLNEETRSVEVVVATESRVRVFDWQRWEPVDEVLLMSGCQLPARGQVVLLDTHSRFDTSSVIGSCRALRVEGAELIGAAHFSSVAEAEGPWTKVREGHLTDFSAGYRIEPDGAVWVGDGERAVIAGREFDGPVRVVTNWTLKELSVCPIGADDKSKARAATPRPHQEDELMDKKTRAFLERQGLPKDATEQEAWDYLERMQQPGEQDTARAAVDEDRIRAEAAAAERERVTEITAMGSRFGCAELAARLVQEQAGIEAARKQVLDHIGSTGGTGPGHRPPASITVDERDKFRSAASDALLVRSGNAPGELAPGADELAGRSLVELSRMALVRAGQRDDGRPLDVVGRALTASDFPIILAAAANKSLFAGFDTAEETWAAWCGEGSVSDFKTHTSARASETDDLDEIPDAGEYKYSKLEEAKEQYAIATYGKLFAITRQTIINDDLNALTEVPRKHGEASARKIGDVAVAVLTANSAMGDGVALFHTSSHANLASSGAVPGVDTLAAAIKAMKLQKDIAGKRRLNIQPRYFIAPVALEGASEVLFKSEYWDGTETAATRVNPYSGTYFTRIYEPRLDDDSATAWYLAAAKGKTVVVYFLDGQKAPYLETKSGWSVDGVEYKVRIDAGAKAMDYRGLYKNPGT